LIKEDKKMGILPIEGKDTTAFTLPKVTIPLPHQLIPFKLEHKKQASQFSREGYRGVDQLADSVVASSGLTMESAYTGVLQAGSGTDFGNRFITLKAPYPARFSVETVRFDQNTGRAHTNIERFTLGAGKMKTYRLTYPIQRVRVTFQGRP
jgi:hypothetical protein